MKLKQITICLFLLILILSICSCGLFGDQDYFCNIDDVESIRIICLDEYIENEYRFEYTILCEIDDCESFVNRLNKIDHSVNWGDPGRLDTGYIIININYTNGDFDLIFRNAQWFNESGVNRNGYFFFDQEQFNALISDYLPDYKPQ